MRHAYTLILYLLLPVVLARLVVRGLRSPGYLQRWTERFGTVPQRVSGDSIWLHAVSFGETQAALPLIRALQQRYPDTTLVITATTATGSQLIRDQLGDSVLHCYMPYDLPFAIRRFVSAIRPRLLIVMETEWWPNLFHYCHTRKIPVMLANTRVSARSARRYLRFRRLTRETLRHVQLIAVQSAAEAQRLCQLGADETRVHVTGNIKFDITIPQSLYEQAHGLRRELGGARPVWIAASTHEGEDQQVLQAHHDILAQHPDSLLILVPRHPERFDRVATLCREQGLATVRRSEQRPCDSATRVFLGDTMGELRLMLAASDVAFIGGSLVATGGHNVLEAAALARPVLFGPHVFNFTAATQLLLEADAAEQIDGPAQLARAVSALFEDNQRRNEIGERAQQVVANNRGALEKTLALVTALLD